MTKCEDGQHKRHIAEIAVAGQKGTKPLCQLLLMEKGAFIPGTACSTTV